MRYLVGFSFVLALGVVGCSETAGTGGGGGNGGIGGDGGTGGSESNRFDIVRDGEKQSYDWTTIHLRDEGSQWVLWARNGRDPLPDYADDEYSDCLRIVFDKDALDELTTDQDHPISGEGSWTSTSGQIYPGEVTFIPTEMHTAAVDHMLFTHERFGCIDEDDDFGAQTFQGSLSLTTIAEGQLAGAIEVRVEGDVPCTDNLHQFYELMLVFDQSYGGTGTDAGTDAGTPAAPTSPDFVVLRREREGL
jgi:hypothetical protein